jgi:hypothetical protein
VTAFCSVDEYDPVTKRTKEGSNFMRYLFATESGELFMLAFHLQLLDQVLEFNPTDRIPLDPNVESSFMNVEFLASKLSFCSSLVYLDKSYVFYGSREGDSYIIKIWAQHKGNPDQPYISIEQTFQSLAPVLDVKLRNPEASHGQQTELVVVSGWNHNTHMNIVKQGISLKSIQSFEDFFAANLVEQYFTMSDRILIKVFGYDQILVLKAQSQENPTIKDQDDLLTIDGIEASRNLSVRSNENIISIAELMLSEPKKVEPKVENEAMKEDPDNQGVKGQAEIAQVKDEAQ